MAQTEMTVFEKMNTPQAKQAFLSRKENSYNTSDEELAQLKEYILSDKFSSDLRRLMDGDFFFSVPHRSKLRKKNSQRKRIIYRFLSEEKMLMKFIAFTLHDYDDLYEDSVYSFRLGKHISEIFSDIRKKSLNPATQVLSADVLSPPFLKMCI